MTERSYPSNRAAWTMVVMLTIAYIFSFVDRYILGLLIEPIKADLGLTDEQIGYLLGPAFAIFYATMGLPLGWVADRKRRTWLVTAGIALWSAATAASGLARNFWHMFIARMSVGVGEATLSPAAMSMIADSFPPERRGRPIAFYAAALTLGAGIASLIGAAVLEWAKSTSGIAVPWVGTVAPWQATFFIVGLPGLIVAAGFLVLREPPRQPQAEGAELAGAGLGQVLGYVGRNFGVYGGFVMFMCVMTIVAYSHGFLPAMFSRRFGWEAQDYALANGIALLALGPLTVNIAGAISDKWRRAGRIDAPFRLLLIGYVAMLPLSVVAPLVPDAWGSFALLCGGTIAIGMMSAVGVTALLGITPAAVRGQMVALYYMAISLAGLLLGPSSVGLLSTRLFGEANIHLALAAVPAIFGTLPLLLAPRMLRRYRERAEAMQAETS